MFDFYKLREEYIAEIEKMPYGEAVLVLPTALLQQEVKLHHMIECIGIDTLTAKILNQSDKLQNYNLLTRQAQEMLIEHLLNEYKDELQYFRPLIDKKGLVRELTGLFKDLLRCNVDDARELADIFAIWEEESNQKNGIVLAPAPLSKNNDIVLLFDAYMKWIKDEKNKVYDLEGQYMWAINLLRNNEAVVPYKKIFLCDFTYLNPLQKEFISCLNVQSKITWESVLKFDETSIPKEKEVSFNVYASHREEMAGTFRDIREKLDAGEKLESFLVVTKSLNNLPGIKYIAEKFGVPVTLPRIDKIAQHPLTNDILDNLGEGNSFAEFIQNARNYLNTLKYESVFGEAYRAGNGSLLELKNINVAKKKLQECINNFEHTINICSFLEKKISKETFVSYFKNFIHNISYVIMLGESKGVMLTDAINALGFKKKHLYVLGVNEGEWPAPLRENWIYTDLERKSMKLDMGIILPTAFDYYVWDNCDFYYLLKTAEKDINFSWVVADNMDKSIYIENVQKVYKDVVVNDHRGLNKGDAVPVNGSMETLCDMANVDKMRSNKKVYNGVITYELPESGVKTLSASALERYVKCPFAYLVQDVWKQAKEESSRDDLERYETGILVHNVIRIFCEKISQDYGNKQDLIKLQVGVIDDKKGGTLTKEDMLKILREIFDLEKRKLLNSKNVTPIMEKEVDSCFNLLVNWLDMELSEQAEFRDMQPLAVEKHFDNFEPVRDLPCRVVFRGSIDRVDEFVENVYDPNNPKKIKRIVRGYYVTDYKTGGVPSGDDNVQLPLYVLALRKEIQEKNNNCEMVVGGSYLPLGKDESRKSFIPRAAGGKPGAVLKKCFENPEKVLDSVRSMQNKFITDILTVSLENMLSGNFKTLTKKTNNCRYCSLSSICRRKIAAGEVENNE